ncbi:hypothetical protein T09_15817, partial [Trichinella sp. T9]
MLHTHKCYINIAITRTCIRQPFTISYMLKFICMLNARSVGKEIYISLTEEERQYMNEIAAFFGNYLLLNMWIRNHVDKYVITKHYSQLMPLSLA